MTTNYVGTFITVSPDTRADAGAEPKIGTIAAEQLALLLSDPYRFTSDELLFAVHAGRLGLSDEEKPAEWVRFFSKPKACLRASALVKQYGWGLHHDHDSKVAAYAVETEDYRHLSKAPDLKQVVGIRSKRA